MKLTTTLLTLSLMANILTASESATSLTQNKADEIQADSLAKYLNDQNEFGCLLNSCIIFNDEYDKAEFKKRIKDEDRKAKIQKSELKGANELFNEPEDKSDKLPVFYGSNASWAEPFSGKVYEGTKFTLSAINKIKQLFNFYDKAFQIMFSSIRKREIWKIFEKDFGGSFSSDKLGEIFRKYYVLNQVVIYGSGYQTVNILKNRKGKLLWDKEKIFEKVNKKLGEELSKLLKEILGENSQNLKNMEDILDDLFLRDELKNDLVKFEFVGIYIMKRADYYSEYSSVCIDRDPEKKYSFIMSLFAAVAEQNFIPIIVHELGHVFQEINRLSNVKTTRMVKDDYGRELISLCFEQSAYLLGYVEKEDAYNSLKNRWIAMLLEAKILKNELFHGQCEDYCKKYLNNTEIDNIGCYGVPFVIAINKAVKLQSEGADKIQIMNGVLELANSDKLWLENLDFGILDEELNEFETSFDKYLDMLEKNGEIKTESKK